MPTQIVCFILFWFTLSAHAAPINKVLSLNLCADILLLNLAEPELQLSITFLAQDMPPHVTLPKSVQFNWGILEEVVQFQPDLVFAHTFTNSLLLQNLEQLQFRVIKLEAAQNIDDIYHNLTKVGEAIQNPQRAQHIINQMQHRLKQMPQFQQQSTLVFYPNGFTVGQHTLASHIMTQLGLHNIADEMGIQFWGKTTLEQILQYQPHFIILSQSETQAPALATRLLQHPSLSQQLHIKIDNRLWHCGTPLVITAMQHIAQKAIEHGLQ